MTKNIPDPKLHKIYSFAKSGIRILAGIALCTGMIMAAGLLIIVAEIFVIIEEIV